MQLIINADDFGINKSINKAIVQSFKKGWVTNTTIMVNMPGTEEAVNLSKDNNFFDKVGLHLNLTEGFPLTSEILKYPVFCNDLQLSGYFCNNYIKQFFLTNNEEAALSNEIEAQILRYINSGFKLMHIDSHCHVHTYFSIYKVLYPLVIKYNFKSIRLTRNLYESIKFYKRIYKYFFINSIKKLKFNITDYFCSFEDFIVLNKMIDNKCKIELMCHPDYDDNGFIVNKSNVNFIDFFNTIKHNNLISYVELIDG